ncbi:MAG TPA: class I SAM-dependent methyltransferase [Casimicrobiaceae bacterium]|nr:class I SAM-dependent methyltransferase [Casimicrobiaceae bacterium]
MPLSERPISLARAALSYYRRARDRTSAGFAPGHFYSPVVDPDALATERERIWPQRPTIAGIDFNDESHRRVLTEWFPRFMPDYDYPEHVDEDVAPGRFYTQNTQFSWLDARALFVLLRAWEPKRIVEVGSGYSSLLIADVNRRHFGGRIDVTCIEPYPRTFLKRGVEGIGRLVERKVQQIPATEFGRLAAGDMLFIDSSHVAKTGSDVNYLYFDVLPTLAAGVRVHVHDIFLPHDYPQDWVLTEQRSWNEQYLLRALLMYARTALRVEFGCAYAFHAFPELVVRALAHPKGHGFGGGSFWFTKLASV